MTATRRAIVGGVGALAALAGVGAAWWKTHEPAADAVHPQAALAWDTPQGGRVSLHAFAGRPLFVNFWATWCPPCIDELPLINDFYRKNKANGWQVLGLAVDKLAPVQSFLLKMPLDFPVGMAGLAGVELSRNWGNLAGGLPFSVVLGSNGEVLWRKLGLLTAADLELKFRG
jgi:thiol-disulfide isomerase/thioredoxin